MNAAARCGLGLVLAAGLSACAVVPEEPYGYGYRPARVVVAPPVAIVAPPVVIGGWWHPYRYHRW